MESEVLKKAFETAITFMSNGSTMSVETIENFSKSNAYPNFFRLQKKEDENEISVDDAREMINFLSQKPSLPGQRAVLIENFEDMSRNAANSILKVLEEPPLDSILILTTTKLLSIIPTIRSRCIKIRVNSENKSYNFNDIESFVIGTLNESDNDLIKKFIHFINLGCKNFIEFAKVNAENFELFLKTALAFCSFKSSHNADLVFSKRLLELQSFFNLTRNTYPDKQSAIIATCLILNGDL